MNLVARGDFGHVYDAIIKHRDYQIQDLYQSELLNII